MENRNAQSEIQNLLGETTFQKQLAHIAVQTGETQVEVNKKAQNYLTELFSEHNPTVNLVVVEIVQYLLSQGYDKSIDVNTREIKALTKLMRKHPVAFVLTHKSYVDLLVLMLVMARHGLPLPYMFAGINLDLFGIGDLVRKNGVIYIRRSFKDDLVYKACLRHFITYLLDNHANFMWALEGTRSRTGKLLWPQMGILKYIMEANHEAKVPVKYVPVSIVYDLIPDVEEMTQEGRGKKKTPENLKWLINYWQQLSREKMGRISLRIGTTVQPTDKDVVAIEDDLAENDLDTLRPNNAISDLAIKLAQGINDITPITTTSLICTSLLSKFAASKRQIESDVTDLMQIIEVHKLDALVDRGRPIGESVQAALNLLTKAKIFHLQGDGLNARYMISREHYLQATYYSNMAVHHLYRRAFIELALLKINGLPPRQRMLSFWTEVMELRDTFKFEFFYSPKAQFTNEIEADLKSIDNQWEETIFQQESDLTALLENQKLLVAPVLLYNYVEAYRVVAHGLQMWNPNDTLSDEQKFVDFCLLLGEEMHWQGRIRRLEAVAKPFLQNGVRLVQNLGLIPTPEDNKKAEIARFIERIEGVANRINQLQGITIAKPQDTFLMLPIEREIVPGSKTESLTREIMGGEVGAHIGAFFDLDRTLIKGFSAKDFFRTRLMSGKVTSRELIAQFAGALSYAIGNNNFASMAAIGAKGVQGIDEKVFLDVGEEVYYKHLAGAIFPESRALVAAHLAMGHTVAIVSAATPYQIEPIARDLKIPQVMCTRMEVKKGKFTGKLIEPTCWGEGKATAGLSLAQQHGLELGKCFFYTDSVEDLPLLEIVGNPRPLNPDAKLASLAFKNDWPVYRFTEDNNSDLTNLVRTGLAGGVFVPAIIRGAIQGMMNLSWTEGVESMMAGLGDFGTAAAGIDLAIKGEEHLWTNRPCVFILNHQSNADFLIAAKLIRKGARGIAKKELQKMPIVGQMLAASGTIFLDRENKDKSIEALAPAVESLKGGTSVVIFPEGTRSYNYTLGKFKKGAFHLAMQAGVPLVPIVLKNAHDAMPRGKNIFKPTLVEVVVLPPIPTSDWTKSTMNEKIDEVRNLFLNELGQLV